MGLEGAAGLYRLNVRVDKVTLVNQCNQRRKSVCLQAFFWGLPVMNIYPAHLCNEYDEATEPNVYKNFEIGTTGYFHSETIELIRSIQRHPILIKIFQNFDGTDTLQTIGTCAVKVTEKFSELISRAATCARKHGISGTIDGVYNVIDKNNIQVGNISLQVQLICYDHSLLKTPLTLLTEQCNPLRHGQSKYLLPQKTSDGYVLIPADVQESNSDGLLPGCEILKENKPDEPFSKEVFCSEIVSKGAAISSPIDITNLVCDASVSESVISGEQNNDFFLCRNPPLARDEPKHDSDSLADEITSYTVEQPPRKHGDEFEQCRDHAMARKLSIETYTSDNEALLDNAKCPKTSTVGRKSSTSSASQERISQAKTQNTNPVKICRDSNSIESIRRSSTAACPCQDQTSDNIPSARTPCQAKFIQTDESNRSESQQDSVDMEMAQRKEEQGKKISSSSSKCSLKQNTLSQSSETSLVQVKASSMSPTLSQCVTFADERASTRNQPCKSPESIAPDKHKPRSVHHVKKADSSSQMLRSSCDGPLEVQFSQQTSYSNTTTSDASPKNEQCAVKRCVRDGAFGTQHSDCTQEVETSTNAMLISKFSSTPSCISEEATEKQLSACQQQRARISTRPSLHRQDCLNAEVLENQPPDLQNPFSGIDATNLPSQPTKCLFNQVQDNDEHYSQHCNTENTSTVKSLRKLSSERRFDEGPAKRRSSRDCLKDITSYQNKGYETVKCKSQYRFSEGFIEKGNAERSNKDCQDERNEKTPSGNRTPDQSSRHKCVGVMQKDPGLNYMGDIYYNSVRTQQLLHGYCAPIEGLHVAPHSQNKEEDCYNVGPNSEEATPQYQSTPLPFPQSQHTATGYYCMGNNNYNYPIVAQQLVQGYCTPIADFTPDQLSQTTVVDGYNVAPNAPGNTSQYQSTPQTVLQLQTEDVENYCTGNNTYNYAAGIQHVVQNYCATIANTPQLIPQNKALDNFSFGASATDETSEYKSRVQKVPLLKKEYCCTDNKDCKTPTGRVDLEQSCCTSKVNINSELPFKKRAEADLKRDSKSTSRHQLDENILSNAELRASEGRSEERRCHVNADEQRPVQQCCDEVQGMYSHSQRSLHRERESMCSERWDKARVSAAHEQKGHEDIVNASRKQSTSTGTELKPLTGGTLPNQPEQNRFSPERYSLGERAEYAQWAAHTGSIQSFNNVHDCGVNVKEDISEDWTMAVDSPRNNSSRCGSIFHPVDATALLLEDTTFRKTSKDSQQEVPTEYLKKAEDPGKIYNFLDIPDTPTSLALKKDSDGPCQIFQCESSSSLSRKSNISGASEAPNGDTCGCVSRRSSDDTEPKRRSLFPTSVSSIRICESATKGASQKSRLKSATQNVTRIKQNAGFDGMSSNNVDSRIGMFFTQACSRATRNVCSIRFSKPRGAQGKMHSHHSGHHHCCDYRETDLPRGSWVSNLSINSSGADSCICMNNRCVWLNCRTY